MSFFADENDRSLIVERLNADPEIAFIVPDGPLSPEEAVANRYAISPDTRFDPFGLRDDGYRQEWKAVKTVHHLPDGRHSLWHLPAGPLPMLPDYTKTGVPIGGPPDPAVPDPWGGWTEQGPACGRPNFGPGCHAEISLELWTRHRPYSDFERARLRCIDARWAESDLLAASGFGWTGGYFSPAPAATDRWWKQSRAWIDRTAVRLKTHNRSVVFHAFRSALAKLRDGMRYDASGWDLDAAIREARAP
jgi:hypothetical protein